LNKHQNRFAKKLSGDKQFRSQDSLMDSSQGSLAYLMYFAQKQFMIFKIFTELFVFITDSLAKYTRESIRIPKLGHFSNISNLQSIFRMTDPLKIVVCSLKSVIQLLGDEFTWESQLPSGEYMGSLDSQW
jgi:hypothetical protein